MSVAIRDCQPAELSTIIDRLDQEFVFGKQRSLSLRKRFPNTISVENLQQVRVAVSEGELCGAHAIRMFNWLADEQTWRGAMIGMVWVDPRFRSQGIGRVLLDSATQFLREREVDFGVLWTGAHTFYERAGWFLDDRVFFGEAAKCRLPLCGDAVSCRELASIEPTWLERVRSRFQPRRVARTPLDYRAVPIPALQVLCFSARNWDDGEGFALVGEQDGNGYFYEMAAPSVLWEPLWSAIAGRFDRLVVNGHRDDPFSKWLANEGHTVWHPQNKCMWLCVSHRLENDSMASWHIPYFDWI